MINEQKQAFAAAVQTAVLLLDRIYFGRCVEWMRIVAFACYISDEVFDKLMAENKHSVADAAYTYVMTFCKDFQRRAYPEDSTQNDIIKRVSVLEKHTSASATSIRDLAMDVLRLDGKLRLVKTSAMDVPLKPQDNIKAVACTEHPKGTGNQCNSIMHSFDPMTLKCKWCGIEKSETKIGEFGMVALDLHEMTGRAAKFEAEANSWRILAEKAEQELAAAREEYKACDAVVEQDRNQWRLRAEKAEADLKDWRFTAEKAEQELKIANNLLAQSDKIEKDLRRHVEQTDLALHKITTALKVLNNG